MERDLKFVFLSTLIVIATVVVCVLFYVSSALFLSALIGIGLATLLNPVIDYIDRNSRINRFFGTLGLLCCLALVFITLFYVAGAIVVEQVNSLKDDFPEIVDGWEKRWEAFSRRYPQVTSAIKRTQPSGMAKSALGFLGMFLTGLAAMFTALTLAVVIALFTAVNSEKYHLGFINLFPSHLAGTVHERLYLSARVLRKWFVAQFIDMCAVGILTIIGLWMTGVDYWALYGVMAGILSIIPYVGILVTVVFSGAVVAVLQPERLLLLLLVFFITQQIEGNFILPKIMKDRVETPAVILIFLMILAGSWFGILGVFMAPPLLAIGVAHYKKYYSN